MSESPTHTRAWHRALELLRRPAAPVAPPTPPAASGRKFTAHPSWTQARLEVEAALAAMHAEREAATSIIATAGERREALFLQPESDAELLAIGSEIDRASLVIERIEHVWPMLQQRLGEVRFYERQVLWEHFRDEAAERLAEFADAAEEYRRRFSAFADVFEEITARWAPDWPPSASIMPRLPRIEHLTAYAEQLETFRASVIMLQKPQPVGIASLQNYIDGARATGTVHDSCPMDWREEVALACRPYVAVELLASFTDRQGTTHAKGAILQLAYEDAQHHVMSGRAVYRENA